MADRFKGTPRERRALSTFVKLMRASDSLHAEASRSLSELGLTPSQFGVLEALHHVGPMCLTELAHKILKTSGNLTMVVDNLEKRGLARRSTGQQDRRFVQVTITNEGSKLMDRIFPEHAAHIADLMDELSPEDQEQLGELCRKLGLGISSAAK